MLSDYTISCDTISYFNSYSPKTRNVFIVFLQNGDSALMAASSSGNCEIVEMLLAHPDIDVNIIDKVRYRC